MVMICAQRDLAATIVRFRMPRRAPSRSRFCCLHLFLFAPFASCQYSRKTISAYGPLRSSKLHSGVFWINLFSTPSLRKAMLRTSQNLAGSAEQKAQDLRTNTNTYGRNRDLLCRQRKNIMGTCGRLLGSELTPTSTSALFHELNHSLKDQLGDFRRLRLSSREGIRGDSVTRD